MEPVPRPRHGLPPWPPTLLLLTATSQDPQTQGTTSEPGCKLTFSWSLREAEILDFLCR